MDSNFVTFYFCTYLMVFGFAQLMRWSISIVVFYGTSAFLGWILPGYYGYLPSSDTLSALICSYCCNFYVSNSDV